MSYLESAKIRIKPGTQGTVLSTGKSSEPYCTWESATVAFDCGAMIIEIPRVKQSSLQLVRRAEDAAA